MDQRQPFEITSTKLGEQLRDNLNYTIVELARFMGREPWEVKELSTDPVLFDKIMREPLISLDQFCEEYSFSPQDIQLLIDAQTIYSFRDMQNGKIYIFPLDVYNQLVMHNNLKLVSRNTYGIMRLLDSVFGVCMPFLDKDQEAAIKNFFQRSPNGTYDKLERAEDVKYITGVINKLEATLRSTAQRIDRLEDKIDDYQEVVKLLEKKIDQLTVRYRKISQDTLDTGMVKYPQVVPKIAIKKIPISVRTLNVLDAYGIHYLEDLKKVTVVDLAQARNMGKHSFAEVLKIASKYNLRFKDVV